MEEEFSVPQEYNLPVVLGNKEDSHDSNTQPQVRGVLLRDSITQPVSTTTVDPDTSGSVESLDGFARKHSAGDLFRKLRHGFSIA